FIFLSTHYADTYIFTLSLHDALPISEDADLAISVPYDSAWTAKINGKTIQTYKTLGGLLGVKITEKGKVNLKYNVPGLKASILISAISIILLYLCLAVKRNM